MIPYLLMFGRYVDPGSHMIYCMYCRRVEVVDSFAPKCFHTMQLIRKDK